MFAGSVPYHVPAVFVKTDCHICTFLWFKCLSHFNLKFISLGLEPAIGSTWMDPAHMWGPTGVNEVLTCRKITRLVDSCRIGAGLRFDFSLVLVKNINGLIENNSQKCSPTLFHISLYLINFKNRTPYIVWSNQIYIPLHIYRILSFQWEARM